MKQLFNTGDIIAPKRDHLPKRKIVGFREDLHSFSKPTIVYSYIDEEVDSQTQDNILKHMYADGTLKEKDEFSDAFVRFLNINKQEGWFSENMAKPITQESLVLWRDKK